MGEPRSGTASHPRRDEISASKVQTISTMLVFEQPRCLADFSQPGPMVSRFQLSILVANVPMTTVRGLA